MRTFQQIGPLRSYLRGVRDEGKTIGLVPTMGSLHEGHLSLFQRAQKDCDLVVASIFVNPSQFAPHEDFNAYPRDLNRDLQLASNAGVGAVFHPNVEEIYPEGFQSKISVSELSSLYEGLIRPGHFDGVATIVNKLFNIVVPERAYFGMKDYQQLLIIERMVKDLDLHLDIVAVLTAREQNGLALSSRNAYLSSEEKVAATVLYRAMKKAEELLHSGEFDPVKILAELIYLIKSEPLATPDYIELVDSETLKPVTTLEGATTLVLLAIRIGKTQLIDNMLIAPEGITASRHKK